MKKLLCLFLLAALTLSSAAAETYPAIVTSNGAQVYSDALLTRQVGTLGENKVVSVEEELGFALKINYTGKIGYMYAADLSSAVDSLVPATVGKTTKVYMKPSASSRSATVKKGLNVDLVAQNGSWSCIEYKGKIGYIKSSFLTVSSKTSSANNTSAQTAQDTGIAFSGTDCDDFGAIVYKACVLYAAPSTSRAVKSLKKNAAVTVTAYNSKWARVIADGDEGFVDISLIVINNEVSVAFKTKSPVYASATASSAVLGTVKAGTTVKVTAYTRTWARITLKGKTGYCKLSALEKFDMLPTAQPSSSATSSSSSSAGSSSAASSTAGYSTAIVNEETHGGADPLSVTGSGREFIYNYARNVMGLNSAAACGILASCIRESGCRPTALASSGHYGICQWGGYRRTNLEKIAGDAGYDPATLLGQMYFMHYELEKSYPSTWKRLQKVSNSPEGAYEAAYWFCYYYEVPAAREASSADRGKYAAETLFGTYSGS